MPKPQLEYDVRIARTPDKFEQAAILLDFPVIDRMEQFMAIVEPEEMARNKSAIVLLQSQIKDKFLDYIERMLPAKSGGTIAFEVRPCWKGNLDAIAQAIAEWIDEIDPSIAVEIHPPTSEEQRFKSLLVGGN